MDASKGTVSPIDVLIIDDDEKFVQSCSRTLEEGGYRVAVAKSGPQGLQTVASAHPGVVLLDLKIPGQTGLEALGEIIRLDPCAVPVVVTAQSTVDSAVESMKLGAFDFLTKPVQPEKLIETVRRALGLSMLRKEAKTAKAPAQAQTRTSDKYDLLLQGLDVLGEAYSLGLEKRQLLDVQETFRWLPRHILSWISGRLNIPLREIYVVANFYEAFSLEPRGRHIVQVCTGTACHVRGASETLTRVSAALGIEPGQTDSKQEFTLETVHCLGCCALAPVVQIDSQYYQNPTRSKLEKIIKTVEKEEAQACLA